MVLVYLTNGDCIEVEGAVSTEQDEGALSCLDRQGKRVATFELAMVQTFTTDPDVAEQMKDDVCEDLSVIRA